MVKQLFGAVTAKLKGELSFIVLLVVAGVGAWLYVQFQQVSADRDDAINRATVICANASVDFAASQSVETATNGKPVTVKHARGALCQRTLAGLVDFKARTDELTAATLTKALADHDARQLNDNRAARSAAEAARNAALRMEAADAEAERKNLVDREWFAAVNGVAGLRPAPH